MSDHPMFALASTIDLDSWDENVSETKRGRTKDERPGEWFASFLVFLVSLRETEGARYRADLLTATYADGSHMGNNAGTIYSRIQPLVKAAKENDPTLDGLLKVIKRKPENAETFPGTVDSNGEYCVLSYN